MRALAPILALGLCACVATRVPAPAEKPQALDRSETGLRARRMISERRLEDAARILSEAVAADRSLEGKEEGEALRRLRWVIQDLDLAERPLRRADLYRGGESAALWVERALEAFVAREDLRAVLFAQAALGADPGNEARRILLRSLSSRTGIDVDPEGVLPLPSLVQHELRKADEAFFAQRFGAAIQACRRALLLDADLAKAWVRLGSAHYAVGERRPARLAYKKALALEPGDAELARFLRESGLEGDDEQP